MSAKLASYLFRQVSPGYHQELRERGNSELKAETNSKHQQPSLFTKNTKAIRAKEDTALYPIELLILN